jgi:zinc-binding alcohol dehydrogenase/oxidoreductase
MKALVLEGVNQPLRLQTVPDLQPGAGEVVVALAAAALNHRDLWIRQGQYAGLKFPIILGSDGCGRVMASGDGVDEAWLGREIIINPGSAWGDRPAAQSEQFRILGLPENGTFAEQVCVPASQLAAKPAHLDAVHAAALPLAGLTAYRALFSRARLQSGERVLLTGIGGGAAIFLLLYATAAGATVFVTSGSDEKIRRATELGAAGGVNYRQADWAKRLKEQASGGFDVIIDSAGGEGFLDLIELAAPGGRIAFFGATRGDPPKFPMRRVFWKQLSILGTTMGSPAEFGEMVRFVADHRITPLADRTFPLADGNDALDAMEASEHFGKLVLTISA